MFKFNKTFSIAIRKKRKQNIMNVCSKQIQIACRMQNFQEAGMLLIYSSLHTLFITLVMSIDLHNFILQFII